MTRPAHAAHVPAYLRALESPLLAGLFGESTLDFCGRLIRPDLTARRVFAKVADVRNVARDVKSFRLQANGHFRGFHAGQHVNLTIEIEGVRHTRAYSPSNAPACPGTVVLTVKRHLGGRVSQWLHDSLHVGNWVELSQAFGDFTVATTAPSKLLLIAGGSGITPIASIVRSLPAKDRPYDVVVLVYARSTADLIFADELRAIAKQHPCVRVHYVLTRGEQRPGQLLGRFTSDHLICVAPDAAQRQAFVCGPLSLVRAVTALWTERGWELVPKTETFTPLEPIASNDGHGSELVAITTHRSGRTFAATADVPLLLQAERAGLSPASGCRQGICFSCVCRKRTGTVKNLSTGAVSSEPDEDIRLCVSVPLSDVTLDL